MSSSGIAGPSYVVPPDLRGGSIPTTVARGDSRPPSVIFQSGFEPRENGTINRDTLRDYAQNNTPGPYVSTTRSEQVAEDFADPNGWVYHMDTPTSRAIDVNHALGNDSPYPEEQEIAVAGGIAGSNIKEARNVETGEIRKNPNYRPLEAPPPPANPNAPGPRHDELKRRKLPGEGRQGGQGGTEPEPPKPPEPKPNLPPHGGNNQPGGDPQKPPSGP